MVYFSTVYFPGYNYQSIKRAEYKTQLSSVYYSIIIGSYILDFINLSDHLVFHL